MECELTNMVMIEDTERGRVVVQDRVKYWKGITFPGGHVEIGESFMDSAIREVREETGLEIVEPKLCGIVHWCHRENDKRYIVLLYKATRFTGRLLAETEEGKVFWTEKDKIYDYKLAPHFDTYLNIFMSDKNEAFGIYDEDEDDPMVIL